jgi:hypothetical protein
MRTLKLAIVPTTALAILMAAAAPARADWWGNVNCDETPDHTECVVTVIDPGGEFSSEGTGSRDPVCRIGGDEVPCHDPALGWLHTDGCYYSPAPEVGPGNDWWTRWCYNPITDEYSSGGTRWLQGAPTAIDNVVQHAVDRLAIPQPAIATNPSNAAQVVHVPVWWWIDADWWNATRNATASIPSLTITAQAEPTSVTWYAGDGSSRTCTGPGTEWEPGTNPAAASPTCGHTYTTASRASTGGTYTLRAEVTWSIHWSGGNTFGTMPPLTTTATTTVIVTELRAVITG